MPIFPPDPAKGQLENASLQRILAKLTESQRQLFLLKYVHNVSTVCIASKLKMSYEQVLAQLCGILNALRAPGSEFKQQGQNHESN